MLHPATQQSPFMVDLHDQVSRTSRTSPVSPNLSLQGWSKE